MRAIVVALLAIVAACTTSERAPHLELPDHGGVLFKSCEPSKSLERIRREEHGGHTRASSLDPSPTLHGSPRHWTLSILDAARGSVIGIISIRWLQVDTTINQPCVQTFAVPDHIAASASFRNLNIATATGEVVGSLKLRVDFEGPGVVDDAAPAFARMTLMWDVIVAREAQTGGELILARLADSTRHEFMPELSGTQIVIASTIPVVRTFDVPGVTW